MTSHTSSNGVDKPPSPEVNVNGQELDEDDPEMEAEQDYAREHGLPLADVAVKGSAKERDPSHLKEKLAHQLKAYREALPVNGVVTVGRELKNQRKSRAGRGRSGIKKDGGGGKFTWGVANQVYEDLDIDPDDPNYDSEANVTFDELAVEVTADVADKYITPIVLEFYANGDIRDAVDTLQEMGISREARYMVVRILISVALDRKNDARELASELLAELVHRRVFTAADTAKAFTALVCEDLGDLIIDYRDACVLLANFIARAVADLALPSDFLETLKKTTGSNEANVQLATNTCERAEALLQHKNLLHDIWGLGGGRKPVRQLSKHMHTILQEYLLNADDSEVSRCLRELEVPHFHHEFVYQAGVLAIESIHERSVRLLAALLSKMTTSGELSASAIEQGFCRLYASLPDLSIDVPPAYTLAEWWTKAALEAGFIGKAVADQLPRKGRKRIVSEGHDGRLMVSDVANPYV